MYQVPLIQFIDKSHELCLTAEQIDWDDLERDLSDYYCVDNGRPSIPIRKIVGVILLKRATMKVMRVLLIVGRKIPTGSTSVEKSISSMSGPLILRNWSSSGSGWVSEVWNAF